MRKILILVSLILATNTIVAQEIINLYDGKVPNSKTFDIEETFGQGMYRGVTNPTLEIYLPEEGKASGTAVIIVPGGGYSVVVYSGEGVQTAKQLVENGIAAFVLKYRLPDDNTMVDKNIGPLQDAQQAIKIVRENAEKYGVDPNKIGIMGFSAGGHLAATAATHYDKSYIKNDNNTSLRPDFQILVYPVISMQDELTHGDSRNQLLGQNPSKETIDLFSNELQVKSNAPPAYLTHATDDGLVDVDNSIEYYEALRHLKVPAEMHLYQKGSHGFVFRHPGWMDPLIAWFKDSNLL